MIAFCTVCMTLMFVGILIDAYSSRYWLRAIVCGLMVFANVFWLYSEATTIGLSDRAILSQLYKYFYKGPSTVETIFDNKEDQKQTNQEQNSNQKRETEWVCTIVENQKICTRQDNKASEDDTSEWDCVTEGNKKICTKHGAGQKWY